MVSCRYPIHPAAVILPMLTQPELRRLAVDIKRRGLIHPVMLYKGMVIDGRNRLKACELAGIEPRYQAVDPELDQRGLTPLEYVVSLNLRRRQLSPSQQALAAAEALPEWTAEGKAFRQGNLMRGKRSTVRKHVFVRGRSDHLIGKLFGVSAQYVRMAARLLEMNAELAGKVQRGECTLSRAVRLQRSVEKQRSDKEQARAIRHCRAELVIRQLDMREAKPAKQFDLILTDPPYSRADIPLFDQLGRLAGKNLVKGGYLAVLSGLQFLDQAIAALARPEHGLQYVWTTCLSFHGPHGRRSGLGIATSWRPILLFVKPPIRKPHQLLIDRYSTTLPPVRHHKWEQAPAAFAPLIKSLSRLGDRVLDPFAGSGAVLEACHILGRNAEGWDCDSEAIRIMESRFKICALVK